MLIDNGINRQLNQRLIIECYKDHFFLILTDIAASVLFLTILWNSVTNRTILLLWFVLEIIINDVLRIGVLLVYHNQQKHSKPQNWKFWNFFYIATSAISGIFWALGGLLFVYVDDPVHRCVIFLFIIAILSAPALKMIAIKYAYIAFEVPIGILLFLISTSITPSVSMELFIGVIIFLALLTYGAISAHKTLRTSILKTLENNLLIEELKLSEDNFRNIIENAPIGMAFLSLDGKYLDANRKVLDILGYSKEELKQLSYQQITHPDDLEDSLHAVHKLINGEISSVTVEKRYIHKNGNIITAISSGTILNQSNDIKVFLTQIVDISDRVANEHKILALNNKTISTLNELTLLEKNEKLVNKLNGMLQLCITMDETYPRINLIAQELFSGFNGALSVLNKTNNSLETVIQWGNDKILKNVFSPEDCFSIREGSITIIDDPKSWVACSHYLTTPIGGYMVLPLFVQNELLGVIHLAAQSTIPIPKHLQDTALTFSNMVKIALSNIKLRETLREQSLRDALTGLYNRRYINEYLPNELAKIMRTKSTLIIIMMDLDDFKKFNDNYGHEAGDEVLKLIGQIINQNFRVSDTACRFGGEEFLITMSHSELDTCIKRLKEFQKTIKSKSIFFNNQILPFVTISIGVAVAPMHGSTMDELIQAADHALYTAKKLGKDRVELYESPGSHS
ncbi:GGDEF domain-containing protein [Legionella quateirensis]|uniref:diguanylate cyclase n=1 Tax=Legionella quateirensis TaxID=45072 RepID=A0A378KU04_9GAMM|nr:sensor domain-containing diguanylate cyclase [Legionella quateirensis]KTD54787.1 regulatory protein (GGDEF, PAS, PAC domains) [Legionella quateirensis]STY16967.1 regulatory protein (GGDEF, PAS, PAC domains) [Legionella quateirensis]